MSKKDKKRNPEPSGSFYLFMFVIVIFLLAAVANFVEYRALLVIIPFALIAITLISAFQMQQDKTIKEENFMTLVKLALLRSLKLSGMLQGKEYNDEQETTDNKSNDETTNNVKQTLANDVTSKKGEIKFENNEQSINENSDDISQTMAKKVKSKGNITFSGNKQSINKDETNNTDNTTNE